MEPVAFKIQISLRKSAPALISFTAKGADGTIVRDVREMASGESVRGFVKTAIEATRAFDVAEYKRAGQMAEVSLNSQRGEQAESEPE